MQDPLIIVNHLFFLNFLFFVLLFFYQQLFSMLEILNQCLDPMFLIFLALNLSLLIFFLFLIFQYQNTLEFYHL
ncbi:MAG: hypothetical protein EB145_18110 [Proteobacteria bacterium]|nr:hypothetical protein [Pseudomonadota bacterium]